MPPLQNQMVVVAAAQTIRQMLKNLGKDVTSITYFTVELYHVSYSDAGATYENQLRAMPQNYTVHTVIDEPKQDYSSEKPQLTVRIAEKLTEQVSSGARLGPPRDKKLIEASIPGSEKFTFTQKVSDDLSLERKYYRHIPAGGDIKGIIIQYHGWGETCEEWEEYSKMTLFADKHDLILITACGSEYGFYSNYFIHVHGWNAGVCCIQRQDIDDIDYTRTILSRENNKNLPVYGYGYSNGGMMVEALLCHKVIDMAVSVNAVLALNPGLQGALKTCDNAFLEGSRQVAPRVASIHCLDDEIVPYNGSTPQTFLQTLASFFTVDLFPRTNRDIRRWANRVGCEKKKTHKTRINDWTRLKEWICPARERVVSIKRFNCSYQGGLAHQVVRTPDFDPAEWAVNFFMDAGDLRA
ncbi:hypothetical protein FOL47_009940 [Perkinsus chesapeaki]|uniref:Uncharacterized protein n=1 Tax=Perkinsus chesapeaki TaxID=330153 RepID=A0A7J6MQN4_PERCH|nr:hypothetical protein FOL47_009940 [Perkinsus chesapeaki]